MTTPTTLPSPLVAHLTHDLATASWVVFVLLFGPPILRLLFGKRRRHRRRHGPLLFGPPDYHTYIASSAWRRKCDRYWNRAGRRCHWPGCRSKRNLQVHHMTYDHLGRERMRELVGLCRPHHDEIGRLFDVHQPGALAAQRRFLHRHPHVGVGDGLFHFRPAVGDDERSPAHFP